MPAPQDFALDMIQSNAQQRSQARQAVTAVMLQHAEHLPSEDKALLTSVYDRGMTVGELARAFGCCRGSVERRLRRLVKRMTSPTFRVVLRSAPSWPPRRRQVAHAVIVRGQSQRQAAAALGMSVHQIRQELQRIHDSIDRTLHAPV